MVFSVFLQCWITTSTGEMSRIQGLPSLSCGWRQFGLPGKPVHHHRTAAVNAYSTFGSVLIVWKEKKENGRRIQLTPIACSANHQHWHRSHREGCCQDPSNIIYSSMLYSKEHLQMSVFKEHPLDESKVHMQSVSECYHCLDWACMEVFFTKYIYSSHTQGHWEKEEYRSFPGSMFSQIRSQTTTNKIKWIRMVSIFIPPCPFPISL